MFAYCIEQVKYKNMEKEIETVQYCIERIVSILGSSLFDEAQHNIDYIDILWKRNPSIENALN